MALDQTVWNSRFVKYIESREAESSCFTILLPLNQNDRAVKVHSRRPHSVIFTGKQLSGSRKQFQRRLSTPLLPGGESYVGQRFSGFVSHSQLFEICGGLASHLLGLFCLVQFEVYLR